MADIDRLDIIISAEASKAEKQLNKLMTALGKLSTALNGLNTSGLNGLANSVQKLSIAMQGMNAIKTTDFTRLAKNIQKLAGIDTKSLNNAASSMSIIGKALSGLGTASANAQAIGDMAKNLSKLGNKGIQNAIANMPQLASSLKNMMQVLQSAPRVSNNLIRMTEAMGKLASNGNRVGSAARSLNSGFKTYGNSTDFATKKTRSLTSAIGLLYAKFWILQRIFKGIFNAVEKSISFSETVNYFEVAMRKIGDDASKNWQQNGYDSAEAYAESFAKRSKELTEKMTGFSIDSDGNTELTNQKSLGLDPDKVLQYQAQYAQMADSIGMTEEAALNTSKALTMLGTDWASLRNISFDQAWEKFASALAGQSRAVRSLGIDITQATLQEYAYKYGLTGAVSEMNQATKAQLRLLAILDQSKVAFGDLANTIQSPANQLRILQQNFGNLARIIGNIFLPVVAKVLPYINGVVIALQRLFQWIAKLLGVKLTSINTSMGGMSDSLGDLVDSGDDGIGGIANDAGDASDALNNANEAAKKLKRTILGFDELNVLNDNDSNNSSGGYNPSGGSSSIPDIGGSDILDDAITDALADYEKAWNDAFDRMQDKATAFADKLSTAFKKIWDTAEPTREALKKLWNEGLDKLQRFSWTALKDFYSEFLVPVGRWVLGKGIPDLVNATNDFLNKIDWTRINKSLKEFWKALAPFAENVGEGLIEFYRDLTSVGADFINKIVPGGLDALAKALKSISPKQAKEIGYALGVLFTAITAFKGLTWVGNILGSSGPLAKGLDALAKHPYAAMAVGIGGIIVALDKFGVIDVDWDWLWSKVKQIKDILSEFISNVDVSGLSTDIGNLWSAFQPFAQGFADALIDAFDILVNDIGAPLINALASAFGWLAEKLSEMDPESLEKIGYALGVIVAVNITTGYAEKIIAMANAFAGLKTVIGTGSFAESAIALASALKVLSAVAIGTSIGLSASEKETSTEADLDDVTTVVGNLTTALYNLDSQNKLTEQSSRILTEAIDAVSKPGMSEVEALCILRDALLEAGISSDELSVAAKNMGVDLGALCNDLRNTENNTNSTSSSIKDAGNTVNSIKLSPLIEQLESLDSATEKVTFSDLITNSSNAIDSMGGIWSNGKQILGEKALAVHAEISKGLEPDDNGFYTLASGQMVQYGNAISDKKDSTKKTLDDTLKAAISNALPDGYQLMWDTAGYHIKGYTEGLSNCYNEVQSAYEKALLPDSSNLGKSLNNSGNELGKNVTSGYENYFKKDGQQKTSLVMDYWAKNGIKAPVEASLSIHSPSKVFAEYAKYSEEGFSEKIKSLVKTTASSMSTWVLNGIKTPTEKKLEINKVSQVFAGYAQKCTSGFTTSITQNIANVEKSISQFVSKIKSAFTKNNSSFMTIGSGYIDKLKSGMESRQNSVSTIAQKMSSTLNSVFKGLSSTMYNSGHNAMQSFANGLSSVHISLPHIYQAGNNRYYYGNGAWFNIPYFNVSWYAKGGFPNVGELFVANEAGPEMVGKMGRKNVVANNKQITEGIKSAVIDGMMEVYMATSTGQDNNNPYILNVTVKTEDNEVLARAVEKGRLKRDARFKPSPAF